MSEPKCVTHHGGCPCYEKRTDALISELDSQLAASKARVNELETQNARLLRALGAVASEAPSRYMPLVLEALSQPPTAEKERSE